MKNVENVEDVQKCLRFSTEEGHRGRCRALCLGVSEEVDHSAEMGVFARKHRELPVKRRII